MTPNEMAWFRSETNKRAAMYGFRFPCKKCGKSSNPAGRKANMVAGKQQGWICAGCVK